MSEQVYRARNPRSSPLWRCLDAHFDTFLDIYPEVYEREYGFLRPIIPEVVEKFMGCGDLRDERGYQDVTDWDDPEVVFAKEQLAMSERNRNLSSCGQWIQQ